MKGFSIGIIGAGQAATELLQQLVAAEFVYIVAIADLKTDAPGIELAKTHKIPTTTKINDILKLGEAIDIIIDVTGVCEVRNQLRQYMSETNNTHTVIMHERLSALMISLAKGALVEMKGSDETY
ncbi:oxidoreductase [Parashewanella curva]|uniref:Oxidoreductase n=1 Tax=Parashewanella curva TaxID=2338552 RepID=A0A3L8PX38_9GAMM|nr:oxidoreductase [Parashewanella curva]RLV59871.1 oxidoreductase [Parashewanella curva]